MTRYFALTLNAGSTPAKPKTAKLRWDWRVKNRGMWIMFALFAISVMYLLEVNSLSTKGYEIARLEQRLLEIKETNERLELEARTLKAVETIKAEASLFNLVPSRGVNYFPGSDYAFQR